ncbi:MAG: hypothetical protein KDA79_21730, partial [Planctomycetaceae bacterium]|nr:hypothetical protein [Planctomycetaceae bacterium]
MILASLCAMPAMAQLPQTRIGAVTPPGGQVGTTFDLVVSAGTDLDELDRLVFSHDGITATQKMNGTGENATPVDKTFAVTIDKSVPPGRYEVRASGLYGISNPRYFVVSATPEILEKEPNNAPEQATPLEVEHTANAVCNGAADVDFFKFTGKTGQRLFVRCLADRIDSQLRPTLELFNSSGRLVSFARHNERRDALLDYQVPAEGEYYIKVSDLTFAGGVEHFYRLQVTQAPHIDFVLPPAGVAGTTGSFTLYGRGLPGGKPAGVELEGRPLEQLTVSIPLPDTSDSLTPGSFLTSVQAGIDGFFYTLDSPAGRSNPVLIQFASAAVGLEQEPNDTPEQASPLTAPGEIAGQFQQRGDIDWYTLEAKAGNVYFIEVYGERGGSSADPLFTLERVQKKDDGTETVSRITIADDTATNLGVNQFDTYTNDPAYRFVVPQDGTYRISVRDRYYESRGNQELVYRLAVREETPDFRVVAVPLAPAVNNALVAGPSSVSLRKGDTVGVNVMAFRQDGFDGPIDVTATNLPKGVTTTGTTIGAGQTSAMMVFSSTEDAEPWLGPITLKATAQVEIPARARALDAAIKQIKPAADAIPKLQEAADKAAAAHKPLAEQAEAAKAAAAKDAENKTLAAQATQAQQKADAAAKVLEQAQAALQAGQKKLADAEAAVEAARKENEAGIRKVEHPVRA